MLLNELLLGHSGVHHTHDPFRIDGQISITMLKRTMLLASLLIFLAIVMSLHGACEFTCPRDHRKIPSGHKSEVNGCGVQGMSMNVGPDLTPAFTEMQQTRSLLRKMRSV